MNGWCFALEKCMKLTGNVNRTLVEQVGGEEKRVVPSPGWCPSTSFAPFARWASTPTETMALMYASFSPPSLISGLVGPFEFLVMVCTFQWARQLVMTPSEMTRYLCVMQWINVLMCRIPYNYCCRTSALPVGRWSCCSSGHQFVPLVLEKDWELWLELYWRAG